MDYLLPILGTLICILVFGQFCWWTAVTFQAHRNCVNHLDQRQSQLRKKIDHQFRKTETAQEKPWDGFRKFIVKKIIAEDEKSSSVYLVPEDRKPLPTFYAGQHLTFRFQIPGKTKPVVRCYSLSDGPNENYYRITVKRCPPPSHQPDAPRGLVSHYINEQLAAGEIIDVKAPGGSFFLDPAKQNPIVLLAGGVGITPMMSIILALLNANSKRQILLVYGLSNSTQHTFKNKLSELAAQFQNLKALTFYSNPIATDQQGTDYDLPGYATANILEPILSNPSLEFYICGPPPFMSEIYNGLIEHGVSDEKIHFEAFGPASIKRTRQQTAVTGADDQSTQHYEIEFCKSNKKITWSNEFENLLELAEANEIELESGCRAGNCGTCELDLLEGDVQHPDHAKANTDKCLTCVARPKSNLKLEA